VSADKNLQLGGGVVTKCLHLWHVKPTKYVERFRNGIWPNAKVWRIKLRQKGSIVDTGAPIYCSVVINKTTLPVASPQEVMPVVSVKE
jgi:hypothetical protein